MTEKKLGKALKGMPTHLENVEGIKFGESKLDYLCVNMPPVCNYRCEKCFTWANDHDLKKFIGVEKINEMVSEAKEMGIKVLGILGEGETLMMPEVKEVIKHAHSLGIIPLIATNGSYLDKEMVDFLYENGVTIAMSLDTLDDAEYKEFCRGAADINIIRKNLEYARKVFAQDNFEKNGYRVYRLSIHMTVTAKNYKNLNDILDFCGDDIYFSCEHIAKVGFANDNPEIYGGLENMKEYHKVVEKTREIMAPMVTTHTKCGKDTCCFYYYGAAVGYEGEFMLDTHALHTKGIIGNVNDSAFKDLVEKSQKIKDEYYSKHGGHYCIIRDPKYKEYIEYLKGEKTEGIGKARC